MIPRLILIGHPRDHYNKGTAAPRLEKARLEAVSSAAKGGPFMFRRLAVVSGVIALGLLLNGCSKCGPFWDDWVRSPQSCKSDRY
jgi:hypothetical protein